MSFSLTYLSGPARVPWRTSVILSSPADKMPDPITLLVVVAAGEASSPTTRAMARAARAALDDAPVEVLETREPPTDEDALALERGAHAGGVVELTWNDPARNRVTLRVHLARGGRWIERSFSFGPADAPLERGRTLGFALRSMLPEGAVDPSMASSPAPPEPSARPAPPPPEPPAPAAPLQSAALPGPAPPPPPVDPTRAPSPVVAESPSAPFERRFSSRRPTAVLDLLALGASGSGGGGGGGGGLEWFFAPRVALRIGGGARVGNVDAAQASSVTYFGSAGAVFQPWYATASRPFEVSIRADYIVLHQALTHFDSDDPGPRTQERWLSGVALMLDGDWLFSSDVGAVVGFGLENAFGATDVYDKGALVVTIPSLRLAGGGGLRARF